MRVMICLTVFLHHTHNNCAVLTANVNLCIKYEHKASRCEPATATSKSRASGGQYHALVGSTGCVS